MTKSRKKVFKGGSARSTKANFQNSLSKFLKDPKQASQRKCPDISVVKKAVQVLENELEKCKKKKLPHSYLKKFLIKY